MPILIDGHNLIGQIHHIHLSAPDDESQLVLLLRRYAARKRGRRIVVVFDGGVYGHTQNLNGYGVECHFAKSPKDADKELIQRLHTLRHRDTWRIVTSDRVVATEAHACGIPVESSQSFAQKLLVQDTPSRASKEDAHKNRQLSSSEIEEWLLLFGIDPLADKEDNIV
jgi:uncharacterized protein